MAITERSTSKETPAVKAENTAGGVGVQGTSTGGRGVEGRSQEGAGVVGVSKDYRGVEGHSTNEHGVFGKSEKGAGVAGVSPAYRGLSGRSTSGQGVWGTSETNIGVVGRSDKGIGVFGKAPVAGQFEGKVEVRGDIECSGDIILVGADYAEEFSPGAPNIDAGTVVVLDNNGQIIPCRHDYDSRLAGVVSGGQGVRPGIVLDRQEGGIPVAMMGKIWALATASDAPIRIGDLLTTSATPGHAKRITDRARALGAVIGKALTPLDQGCGLVRVLVGRS